MAPPLLRVRPLQTDEAATIDGLRRARTEAAQTVLRAQIIWHSHQGQSVDAIAQTLGVSTGMVRKWVRGFNARGIDGLQDAPKSGRPPTYTPEQVSTVVATALTDPQTLGLPFAAWTLDRLQDYLNEERGIGIRRSRINDLLRSEGLRWRKQESWFGERVDPDFVEKKGAIVTLYQEPPPDSLVICLDEMGPESAKSYPGSRWLAVEPPQVAADAPAVRATQEADYGRRGKGYVFGAFAPHTGQALTHCYEGRTTAAFVDFLERTHLWLQAWAPQTTARIYAVLDNLRSHHATDVLLFALAHPTWEFVFQPKYAAYLNLIEPWWKVLRSLALKGKCFACWADVEQALADATRYWNSHRHPFQWGRRRRHRRPSRPSGIAVAPLVT